MPKHREDAVTFDLSELVTWALFAGVVCGLIGFVLGWHAKKW
jgi:hypothetical protein